MSLNPPMQVWANERVRKKQANEPTTTKKQTTDRWGQTDRRGPHGQISHRQRHGRRRRRRRKKAERKTDGKKENERTNERTKERKTDGREKVVRPIVVHPEPLASTRELARRDKRTKTEKEKKT